MSKGISVKEAAVQLGMTPGMVRYRLQAGELKGRQVAAARGQGYEWRVYLNGDEAVAPKPQASPDPLNALADELIALGRKLKRSIKEHDEHIRRDTIAELGSSLVETAKKRR